MSGDARPRRIVIASDFFHPAIGGAERQVRLLAAALAARGHDVRVATVRRPGESDLDHVDGVAVHRLPAIATSLPLGSGDPAHRFLPPAPDPQLVLALRALIGDSSAEVVHANGWIAYSCAAAVEGRGTTVVLSVRDYGYSCATRTLLHRDREICSGPGYLKCLDCAGRHYGAAKGLVAVSGVFAGRPLLRRQVRGIHSVSRFVQSIVERDLLHGDAGWRPVLERIPDIVPGPSAPEIDTAEEGLVDRLPREPFILFVGVLRRHKGLDVLLDAYHELAADRGSGAPPLVLIGSRHPDTPRHFPHGVTLLSDVPHAVVMAAWERSLFGVAPSVWPDPLPGVVREAMSRGRPVVATAVGGNLDMVEDGVSGLLVPPSDARALASAMGRLVDDGALRDRLGAAARSSVAGMTPEGVAARFEDLYARALRAA